MNPLVLDVPRVSDIALAAVARHLCSYLPPNFRGGVLTRAELLCVHMSPAAAVTLPLRRRAARLPFRPRKPEIERCAAARFPLLVPTREERCST